MTLQPSELDVAAPTTGAPGRPDIDDMGGKSQVARSPGVRALPAQQDGDERLDRLRADHRSGPTSTRTSTSGSSTYRTCNAQSVEARNGRSPPRHRRTGYDLLARMMRGTQRDFEIIIIATVDRPVHRHPDRGARRLLRQGRRQPADALRRHHADRARPGHPDRGVAKYPDTAGHARRASPCCSACSAGWA